MASGRATPIEYHHGDFLAQSLTKARTKSDDRRAIAFLSAWCGQTGTPATLEKTHPDFLAALAKRGITDVSLVCSDPWSCGVFGHPDEVGRRLIQTIKYAHPVEG